MTKPRPPVDDRLGRPNGSVDWTAVAARVEVAVKVFFGSQRAAAAASGVGQSAISKVLSGRVRPSVDLLLALAARGADVSALLTGATPALAAVPRFARLLPGPPGRSRDAPAGLVAVPKNIIAPGTYAVTFDAAAAAVTLGGVPYDRPRAGDTIVVMTDVAAVARFAAQGSGTSENGWRGPLALPPPVVLVGGVPILSLVHRVQLAGWAEGTAVRAPLTAEPPDDPAGLPPAAAGPLPAVGFAVWRAGPVGA